MSDSAAVLDPIIDEASDFPPVPPETDTPAHEETAETPISWRPRGVWGQSTPVRFGSESSGEPIIGLHLIASRPFREAIHAASLDEDSRLREAIRTELEASPELERLASISEQFQDARRAAQEAKEALDRALARKRSLERPASPVPSGLAARLVQAGQEIDQRTAEARQAAAELEAITPVHAEAEANVRRLAAVLARAQIVRAMEDGQHQVEASVREIAAGLSQQLTRLTALKASRVHLNVNLAPSLAAEALASLLK